MSLRWYVTGQHVFRVALGRMTDHAELFVVKKNVRFSTESWRGLLDIEKMGQGRSLTRRTKNSSLLRRGQNLTACDMKLPSPKIVISLCNL